MAYDRKYMLKAIELAKKGEGWVNPNPLVGAVIVKDDKIIGEGYHTRFGELHAEREAIKNASEKGFSCKGAEMYVTLEPCCHTGKQPPCTEAIIEAGIKRVYVGSDDPNPIVAGNGIWALRENNVEVITHSLKEECDKLNPVFFHFMKKNIPYIVYKYAMTLDGKTATVTGNSRWISNESSRAEVQKLRNKYMAIMVGIGTVLKDDPSLLCHMEGGKNPIRIICDSELRIPLDSTIVKTANEAKTYIVSKAEHEKKNRHKIRELKEYGIGTLLIPTASDNMIDLNKLMQQLGKMHIDSVLLEGGGELSWSFLSKGFVDEIKCFIAPKVFGGKGPSPVNGLGIDAVADSFNYVLRDVCTFDGDVCLTYMNSSNEEG